MSATSLTSPQRRGAALALLAAALFGASTPLAKLLLGRDAAAMARRPALSRLRDWPRALDGIAQKRAAQSTRRGRPATRRLALAGRRDFQRRRGRGPSCSCSGSSERKRLPPRSCSISKASSPRFSPGSFSGKISIAASLPGWSRSSPAARSFPGTVRPAAACRGACLCIAGACLAWALDNNLTRKVSAADPVQTTMIKGLVAGSINTTIAWLLTHQVPSIGIMAAAGTVGLFSYGISLTFFVLALRHLGTARTGALFFHRALRLARRFHFCSWPMRRTGLFGSPPRSWRSAFGCT